jgi:hypothetical protein
MRVRVLRKPEKPGKGDGCLIDQQSRTHARLQLRSNAFPHTGSRASDQAIREHGQGRLLAWAPCLNFFWADLCGIEIGNRISEALNEKRVLAKEAENAKRVLMLPGWVEV